MDIANDLKVNAEKLNGIARASAEGMKARAKDGFEFAVMETRDVADAMPWKAVLGVAVGFVLVAGVIVAVRRRTRRAGLLQRGLREGARFAVMIPEGLSKARKSADRLAEESVEMWRKLPKVRIEVK